MIWRRLVRFTAAVVIIKGFFIVLIIILIGTVMVEVTSLPKKMYNGSIDFVAENLVSVVDFFNDSSDLKNVDFASIADGWTHNEGVTSDTLAILKSNDLLTPPGILFSLSVFFENTNEKWIEVQADQLKPTVKTTRISSTVQEESTDSNGNKVTSSKTMEKVVPIEVINWKGTFELKYSGFELIDIQAEVDYSRLKKTAGKLNKGKLDKDELENIIAMGRAYDEVYHGTIMVPPSDGGGGSMIGGNGEFLWPLKGDYPMTSGYGSRIDPITGKPSAFHGGIDMGAQEGTPVYSSIDGMITKSTFEESSGNIVKVKNGQGFEFKYMHLSKRHVKFNERVKKGQLIGEVGSTGRSTGPHLHIEVWEPGGVRVNPLKYFSL